MNTNFKKVILNLKTQEALRWISFVFLLLGSKLILIAKFGNATPYWDQWDAEGLNLYQPLLTKSLSLKHIFALHNEHRIVTARLLALMELGLNEVWNPLLQMVTNSFLHVFVIGFCVVIFAKSASLKSVKLLMVFALILFSLPYAWENTLAGFQSQFYFVILFNLVALWLLTTGKPFSRVWWLGLVSAGFAFFSLASGVFSLAAAAGTNILFYILNLRRTKQQIASIIILSIFFLLGAIATPSLAGHAHLKAASLQQFIDALLLTLGWPNSLDMFVSPNLLPVMIRNLPASVLVLMLIKRRPGVDDRRWFLFSCTLWMIGTAVSISYGRAIGCLSSRYLDLFAISVFINFVCLLTVVSLMPRKRTIVFLAACIWSILVLSSAVIQTGINTPSELSNKHSTGLEQELNTRNYILTGDIGSLRDKPYLHIPYPDPDVLAMILNLPELRKILPKNIVNPPGAIFQKNIGRLDRTVDFVLQHYYIFYVIGFSALTLLLILRCIIRLQSRSV